MWIVLVVCEFVFFFFFFLLKGVLSNTVNVMVTFTYFKKKDLFTNHKINKGRKLKFRGVSADFSIDVKWGLAQVYF